jgi:Bacterial PH domain
MTGRVFRSQGMRVAGWAWMVFALLNFVDIAWRGRDRASAVAGAILLLGCGVAYVVALRPRIDAGESGFRLVNLVRDVTVPWGAVERIKAVDAVLVYAHGSDRPFRAFVLQTSARSKAKMERRSQRDARKVPDAVAAYVKDRTPTDYVADQLNESLDDHRRKSRDEAPAAATVTWSWPSLLALVVPAVIVVVAAVA